MISCITTKGIEYITQMEHFRSLMDEKVYEALMKFINNNKYYYEDIIEDLKSEIADLEGDIHEIDNDLSDLQCNYNNLTDVIYEIIDNSDTISKESIIERLKESVNYKKYKIEDVKDLIKK